MEIKVRLSFIVNVFKVSFDQRMIERNKVCEYLCLNSVKICLGGSWWYNCRDNRLFMLSCSVIL